MAFNRKWIIAVIVIIIVFLLLFRGITSTVKAVTVSTNDIKEKDNESSKDSVSVVLDDKEDIQTDQAADTADILESGETDEAFEEDSGESGQDLYMDQDLIDSILAYLNWSYKADLIQLVLIAFLCGISLASLIMGFFMK